MAAKISISAPDPKSSAVFKSAEADFLEDASPWPDLRGAAFWRYQ
jgi:hypothetical protein